MGSWSDVQLGVWMVCIGIVGCNTVLSLFLCWARRDEASHRAVGVLMLAALGTMLARALMYVSDDAGTVMLASRCAYSSALLIPPAVMFLAALELAPRARRVIVVATALPALAPWIDPLVFSGGVIHSPDVWDASMRIGELSPVAIWLVPYGPLVLAAVVWLGRRAVERDLRAGLVTATLVIGHTLPLEVAIDAGLVEVPRLAFIGLAIGSTAILHVLLARVGEAIALLRTAQQALAVRRALASDDSRQVERLAALGEAAMQLVSHINLPVRRLAHDLDLLAEDVHMAAQGAHATVGEFAEAMADARHDAMRLRDTVSRVADFATADVSGEGLCQVRDCISSAIDMLRNELRHHARLSIDAASEVMVRGNDARLTRLFMLVIHAGVYWTTRRRKGGTVHVSVETGAEELALLVTCESSNGPLGELEFDPYAERQATHDGLGLELATAHRLATAFGGSVRQLSNERGPTLEVVLPRAVLHEEPA